MQERIEHQRTRDLELIGHYLIEGLNRADMLRMDAIDSLANSYFRTMKVAEVRPQ